MEVEFGWLFLPWGVISDIYNIVIGAPSTPIINPWRKMVWEKNIILQPTRELEEKCHKNKNSFISNNGCIDCNRADREIVYASPEECSRCPSRVYYQSKCLLSTDKLKQYEKNVKEECHKKDLVYTDKGCISCNEAETEDNKGDYFTVTSTDKGCILCNEIEVEDNKGEYFTITSDECKRCSGYYMGSNGHCKKKIQ